MKIDKLQSYEDVIKYLSSKKRPKHLLLGNGFSMAYDSKIFSYNALSSFIDNTGNDLLKTLFKTINTKNFELIMQQLDNFIEIAKVFSTDKDLVRKITEANQTLKDSLIEAVKELHPEHVFSVPQEKSQSCFSFLNEYLHNNGKIFSTNYDLLLYWVLMRNKQDASIDGFGRDLENQDEIIKGDDPEFSELRWGNNKKEQNVFYLHGTLPFFDTGIDIVKEEYDTRHYLLEKISERMEAKEYPIFVTAGNAKEKLNHIMHNKYLSHCFEQFSAIEGSLITFGFNFGEYDTHLIDAVNKACLYGRRAGNKLHSVYIGVYSDENVEYIESIKSKFKCKVNMYNARTAKIW
ncbi:DUF4917 family protein [Tenacibaculum dicentrarchi]|uniref:DUF4917 family protein n=1 Tax=Tenacibaculum finnmarkense TaxID=2781243 RepID=UPI001E54DFAC|nr:DUF4917 family protein [Tenacibaculum finnmarkense]MCD8438366.1 DUF4917 family protein [Tenacibaculum dicentrarchi]MCD8445719.1 DUF4917 family protein [Tenacibaculum finnmarkense genomovar ulcerans]MCD8452712.1 DUF4917 family protein [Tenacibaculum dicentrarchi]